MKVIVIILTLLAFPAWATDWAAERMKLEAEVLADQERARAERQKMEARWRDAMSMIRRGCRGR